ncbi:MAG: hypothetical protein ACRDK0_04550 [Solirubrobacteraceae bacterium]
MRLVLTTLLLLLLPGTAAAAADLSFKLETSRGVQFGAAHEAEGFLTQDGLPLAGQPVEIQARPYPFDGEFERILTLTTGDDGSYGFRRGFGRNVQLRAVAPAQSLQSAAQRAYVFPRPRSIFKALDRRRLRITQYLRTPGGVRLTAKTIFYLGPRNARRARPVARARPKRIGSGRFKATATVRLPRSWNGSFRYGSCFRYSEGTGLGDPKATCPRRYRF